MCKIMEQHSLSFSGYAFMAARELAPALEPKSKKAGLDVFGKALYAFNKSASKVKIG